MGDGYLSVPEELRAASSWDERVRTESTVFQTPTSQIVGRTALYDDRALRDAVDAAGDRPERLPFGATGADPGRRISCVPSDPDHSAVRKI